jgi:hypothetical protein
MPRPTQTNTDAQKQHLLNMLSESADSLARLLRLTEALVSATPTPSEPPPTDPAGAVPPFEHRPNQFAASPSVARLFVENPIEPTGPQTVSRGKTMALEAPPHPPDHEIGNVIGEELSALSANYLRRAQATGDGTAVIARDGRFVPTFAADLLDRLPIDPYRSPDALTRLHADLVGFIDATGGRFPWGRLQRHPDGSITVAPPDAAGPA